MNRQRRQHAQRQARKASGEQPPEAESSLRAQAFARATEARVPRTLTAWEWEQWYAAHGQPHCHRQGTAPRRRRSLWQRLFGPARAPRANCARDVDEDAEF